MRKKRNQVSGRPTVHQPRGQTVLRRVLRRTLLQTVCRLLETHHRSVGELFQLLISLCDPSQLYCSCGLMDSSGNILTDLSKVDFLPSTTLFAMTSLLTPSGTNSSLMCLWSWLQGKEGRIWTELPLGAKDYLHHTSCLFSPASLCFNWSRVSLQCVCLFISYHLSGQASKAVGHTWWLKCSTFTLTQMLNHNKNLLFTVPSRFEKLLLTLCRISWRGQASPDTSSFPSLTLQFVFKKTESSETFHWKTWGAPVLWCARFNQSTVSWFAFYEQAMLKLWFTSLSLCRWRGWSGWRKECLLLFSLFPGQAI